MDGPALEDCGEDAHDSIGDNHCYDPVAKIFKSERKREAFAKSAVVGGLSSFVDTKQHQANGDLGEIDRHLVQDLQCIKCLSHDQLNNHQQNQVGFASQTDLEYVSKLLWISFEVLHRYSVPMNARYMGQYDSHSMYNNVMHTAAAADCQADHEELSIGQQFSSEMSRSLNMAKLTVLTAEAMIT